MKKGVYHWRVRACAGDKKSPDSEGGNFTVEDSVKPVTVYPGKNGRLLMQGNSLSFSWRDGNRAGRYLLEVSGTEDFSEIIVSEKTTSEKTVIKNLKPGEYYWRVTALGENDTAIAASMISGFTLSSVSSPPVIKSPALNSSVNKAAQRRINFIWSSSKGSTHYRIEIYFITPEGRSSIHSSVVPGNSFSYGMLSDMKERDYLWEISGGTIERGEFVSATETSHGSFRVIKQGWSFCA